MTTTKIILVGLGGQGVVFLTRLLAQVAVTTGYPIMISETHGMSQRGGSVISHLTLGNSQAPLIRRGTADFMLALERDEAVRHLGFLRPGGTIFVNSEAGLQPELRPYLVEKKIHLQAIPASQIALELGKGTVANVVLAAFALAHPDLPLPFEALRQTVEMMSPAHRSLNLKALDRGLQASQLTTDQIFQEERNYSYEHPQL